MISALRLSRQSFPPRVVLLLTWGLPQCGSAAAETLQEGCPRFALKLIPPIPPFSDTKLFRAKINALGKTQTDWIDLLYAVFPVASGSYVATYAP
jgi:hypothetical protein